MIEFNCKRCGAEMEAPLSLAGGTECCQNCGLRNPIPEEGGPAEPGPLARQCADERAELNPFEQLECTVCKAKFPLVISGQRPSLTCPVCGYVPAEELCAFSLYALEMIESQLLPKIWWPVSARIAKGQDSETSGQPLQQDRQTAIKARPDLDSHAGASVVRIRCSNCGAVTEPEPCEPGQDEICPECGKKYSAADCLAAELIAFYGPNQLSLCGVCKTDFSIMQYGVTCPKCGYTLPERLCEKMLNYERETMGDWRKIKRLGELLNADSNTGKTPRFICPFCKAELPAELAKGNYARVKCPACHHDDVYVYNREAFQSPAECVRVLEFRLKKRRNAQEEARERELAKVADEIVTGTKPNRGQANGGYVYILINAAMQGHFKVGMTEREPEDRARELSAVTGIPTPFAVAYAEWFKDCYAGEKYVHALLEQKGFRVTQNREFFCAPVKAAIQAVMKAKERDDEDGGLPPK